MAAKTPKAPSAGEFDNEFMIREETLRGVTYKFRELTVGTYDDQLKLCTSTNENGDEMIDNQLLSRFLAVETIIEPKMGLEQLQKLPVRVFRRINQVVNELTYGTEQPGEKKDEPDIQEGDPEEGEG